MAHSLSLTHSRSLPLVHTCVEPLICQSFLFFIVEFRKISRCCSATKSKSTFYKQSKMNRVEENEREKEKRERERWEKKKKINSYRQRKLLADCESYSLSASFLLTHTTAQSFSCEGFGSIKRSHQEQCHRAIYKTSLTRSLEETQNVPRLLARAFTLVCCASGHDPTGI